MIEFLPEIRPLLSDDRLKELVCGSPNLDARTQLQELERLLPTRANDRDFALACVAGLWLLHDFQDESHAISQELDTVDGSYWHAILHRREPDYGNAKYWFRQVGEHPVFEGLRDAALKRAPGGIWPAFLSVEMPWDPAAFVNLCEAAPRHPPALERWCRAMQRLEWHLLFAYCHERAFDHSPLAPGTPGERGRVRGTSKSALAAGK